MINELSDLLQPSDRKQLIKECFDILRELLHTPDQTPEFRRRTAEGILKYLVPKARHTKDPPARRLTKQELREQMCGCMTEGMAKPRTDAQSHDDEQTQLAEEARQPETESQVSSSTAPPASSAGTGEPPAQEKEPHHRAALESDSHSNANRRNHGKMPRSW